MSDQVEVVVNVLGVFEARAGGTEINLGGRLPRLVLARLLAAGDAGVTADEIVDDVWGARGVDLTPGTLHAYVSRLRRLLGPAALRRDGRGYVMDRSQVTVDAVRFADEVARGRAALRRGDDAAAVAVLRPALARWRGPHAFGALAGTPFLAPEAARLEDLRVAAAELLADALARHGAGPDRDGERDQEIRLLEELAALDPLREPLAVRLVRALDAAGRQADALAAYERCRRALAEELGVDPTPALRAAHAAVLAQGGRAGARPALLTNLPPRNRSFVGRAALLAQVERTLDDDGRRPRAVVLTGLAGTGKTELALELAYRRGWAGQVAWWVAAEDPSGTAASLADLAVALGVPPRPRKQDTLIELGRALDRTPGWVLVFDNADDPQLLAPFLPTADHGDVLITSRNPAWRRLAQPVVVPVMHRAESVAYLAWRSGDPDPAAGAALAELVGDLPLALEQAGAYVEQTGTSVADYVRLFRSRRADMLLRGPVAMTWGLAFDRVRIRSPLAAALLETIAFLSADAIGIDLIAPLAPDELGLHDAVAVLLRLSLVDRQADTLRVHRLVQDVVRARLPEAEFRSRLADAAALCVADHAGGRNRSAHLLVLAQHSAACGWVAPGLVAALAAAAREFAEHAVYPAAEQVLRQALRLVGGTAAPGERVERGALTCQLGEVLDAAGRLDEALPLHEEAVALLTAGDVDPAVLAHAHNRLGHVLNCADRGVEAIDAQETAVAVLRTAARDDVLAPVLIDMGYTLWAVGRLDDARAAFDAGLALLGRFGRRESRDGAHATAGLGMVAQDEGDLDLAVAHHRAAIAEFTRVCGPEHPDTAQAYDKLGYTLRLQGHVDASVVAHRRAWRLLERLLGPEDSRVAMTLSNLGLAHAESDAPGAMADAVAAQSRAHAVFLATLGPDHASTAMAARRLAAVAGALDVVDAAAR